MHAVHNCDYNLIYNNNELISEESMKTGSPFLYFDRAKWGEYRQDTPFTLSEADVAKLQGQYEIVTSKEIFEIYLPLARLLSMYVTATQELYKVTGRFLGNPEPKVPYIIGIAGSVAVGKSTTSRVLKALLSCCKMHPNVNIISTDGFLYPNMTLKKHGLMHRKGFPESYDLRRLINFLTDLKSGKRDLHVPIYSHELYDITNNFQTIVQPDIVILEGLNILQVATNFSDKKNSRRLFVSDFFDFSIYVDAQSDVIKQWYLDRFMYFRKLAKNKSEVYMHRFSVMSEVAALECAIKIWHDINELNLIENILPYRERARLILEKAEDHTVQNVLLRKI